MPIHDWTRVDAGIFHAFHHDWISELAHTLNRGLLPNTYYALPEQITGQYGPDVLTLQGPTQQTNPGANPSSKGGVLALPKLKPIAETHMDFYRRKQKALAIRHVSDDSLVAMIEIVSPGNKAGKKALRAFVEKAADLLDRGIHLLVIDLHPTNKLNPQGIHGAIWEEITGQTYEASKDKPLTLAAYETGNAVRAYVVNAAVGDVLPDMPLFLQPEKAVEVPLEATYMATFVEQPARWRQVLEPTIEANGATR